MTFKDKYNNLAEIFSQPGTSGGCTGLTEALTRTVSLLFRSGVHPEYIIDQLQSVKCPVAMNARKEGKCDGKSCSDIIAKELLYQLGKSKNTLKQNNNYARSPTLQTVLMVEKFINENSGDFKKTELFHNLPKKVMWQTFQVIMEYLESVFKIVYDKEDYVVYIWNPEFYEKIKDRPAIGL